MKFLNFFLLLFIISGCMTHDDEGQVIDFSLPSMDIGCSSLRDATDCGSSEVKGKNAYVYWSSVNCLEEMPPSSFYAVGTVALSTGISPDGDITSWTNSSGSAISTLDGRKYYVCAYIDTDGNESLTVGEPYIGGNYDFLSSDDGLYSLSYDFSITGDWKDFE
jgi:hypothetical protein